MSWGLREQFVEARTDVTWRPKRQRREHILLTGVAEVRGAFGVSSDNNGTSGFN